jgi:hypothetical protein
MASGLRKLARWFLEKRYLVLARLFGLSFPAAKEVRRGAVFIQVDALGYANLQTALEKGYMPYLKGMLESGAYTLRRWRCGLPSDTPPVQSGIMFGYNQDLVGFYWMDKASGRRINCANPPHAKALEEQIAARGRPGLLTQGSTYATILSGQARKAVFTVSRLDSYRLSNGYGLLGAFAFIVFKPPILLTTAAYFLWDLVQEVVDYLAAVWSRRPRRRERLFPITRAIMNVAFRETATAGTIMDMYCGVPVIYTAYLGYDLVGHHTGPLSPNALRTLKGIDRAIREIDRTRKWCRLPYDLYVLSDHGMTPSVPLHLAHGQPLADYITSVVSDGTQVEEYDADRYLGRDQLSPLSKDLQELEKHLPWFLKIALRGGRALVGRGDGYQGPIGKRRLTIIDCSPIAHLYIQDRTHRMGLGEITELYPSLVPALVAHPGIGLVVGVEGEHIVVLSKEGKAFLGQACRVEGQNPFAQFEEPELAAREIRRLAFLPQGGDLILFGAFKDGQLVCFQSQFGGHGSIGGDQFYPFFVHPSHLTIPLEKVTSAVEMYPIFLELTGRGESRKETNPPPTHGH